MTQNRVLCSRSDNRVCWELPADHLMRDRAVDPSLYLLASALRRPLRFVFLIDPFRLDSLPPSIPEALPVGTPSAVLSAEIDGLHIVEDDAHRLSQLIDRLLMSPGIM